MTAAAPLEAIDWLTLTFLTHKTFHQKRIDNSTEMLNRGDFFYFVQYFIQHCFICRPSDSTVSEDAGIDPRTSAPAVRRSNLLDRSHPHTRLDLIYNIRLDLIHLKEILSM